MPNSIVHLYDTGNFNINTVGKIPPTLLTTTKKKKKKKKKLVQYALHMSRKGTMHRGTNFGCGRLVQKWMEAQIHLANGYPERRCL